MGVDSLSVNPDVIPELKRAFAVADAGPLRAGMDELLDLGDAAEIEERLNSLLPGSNGVAGT
jgi:phosphoenolpyruvate-protein kinase (PTS system EI component)